MLQVGVCAEALDELHACIDVAIAEGDPVEVVAVFRSSRDPGA